MEKKRILLVEDDASIAFIVREHLLNLGSNYEIGAAFSAEDALRQFGEGVWDLVITDNKMSGMTGLELIQALKDRYPGVVTILATGYGSEQVEQFANQLNVFRYMVKPFPLADLNRAIQDAFSLANLQ
ncbi:MAG: response regulator [Acidobacteriota bacterium]